MKLNKHEKRLLFNKKVESGLSPEKAYKEVERDCKHLEKLTLKKREEKKKQKPDFKQEFAKLQNGQRKV
jgi:ketol-acid reductoisomerase